MYHATNTTMDYNYYGHTPQAYFIDMQPAGYATQPHPHALDPDKIRSIEPLDVPNFLPQHSYDGSFALPQSHSMPSPDAALAGTSLDSGLGGDMDDVRGANRGSSEEKEASLTPAQSRRKAQNRAAQRAFRERKERHVRDLEAKLTALETSTHNLQSDNARLKLALQRAKTENEILRATSTSGGSPSSRPHSMTFPAPGGLLPLNDDEDDDEPYSVQEFPDGNVVNSADKTHAGVADRRGSGGRMVPAAEMWDVIQSHPLVQQGAVDMEDVCLRVRKGALCHGKGPVYEEHMIWKAIENARRSEGDGLI